MTVRVRQPARFDRSSPVLRYWLSRCEGFDVSGGARGVVTEVVSDGDPIDPDAIVVRTRIRKRTLDARSIAAVIPAERRLVVETARRTSARRSRGAGEARRYAAAAGRGSAVLGRQSAVAGRGEIGRGQGFGMPRHRPALTGDMQAHGQLAAG